MPKHKRKTECDLSNSAVQIFVRFRPPRDGSGESRALHRINSDMVRVDGKEDRAGTPGSTPRGRRGSSDQSPARYGGFFKFHRIFGPATNAEEVYTSTTASMVDTLFEGLNCTVMAYGQTGSGKTCTMLGREGEANRGVIPRALESIFAKAETRKADGWSSHVKISNVQIYMEKVLDLLKPRAELTFDPDTEASLHVRQRLEPDGTEEIYVEDVTWKEVRSSERALKFLNEGNSRRVIASTDMNAVSSRSHSVFLINVKQENIETQKKLSGKLYLVDLAGSEKVTAVDLYKKRYADERFGVDECLLLLGGRKFLRSTDRLPLRVLGLVIHVWPLSDSDRE